jgi:biopolymer transport protein ExbD
MAKTKPLKQFDSINITPLTDIFLVLLIIMMVVAPLLNNQGLSLQLPRLSENSENQEATKVIQIKVLANNQIQVNDAPLSAKGSLIKTLKTLKPQFPEGVVLSLHPKALHATSMKVLDAIEAVQIQQVSIVEARD